MTKIAAILISLIPASELKADGFPFIVETHEVVDANVRLPLTESQQVEVASLGHITFDKEQLGWLRLIYPKIPDRVRVIASTFNDNLERNASNHVDCIWTKPTEIGITLPKKWSDSPYTFEEGYKDIGEAVDMNVDFADIRISPSGTLYHRGLEISLKKALTLIKAVKRTVGSPLGESDTFLITLPPPFRSQEEDEVAKNKKVADAFATLSSYGETNKITVQQIW